jgi:hypothetical protein
VVVSSLDLLPRNVPQQFNFALATGLLVTVADNASIFDPQQDSINVRALIEFGLMIFMTSKFYIEFHHVFDDIDDSRVHPAFELLMVSLTYIAAISVSRAIGSPFFDLRLMIIFAIFTTWVASHVLIEFIFLYKSYGIRPFIALLIARPSLSNAQISQIIGSDYRQFSRDWVKFYKLRGIWIILNICSMIILSGVFLEIFPARVITGMDWGLLSILAVAALVCVDAFVSGSFSRSNLVHARTKAENEGLLD